MRLFIIIVVVFLFHLLCHVECLSVKSAMSRDQVLSLLGMDLVPQRLFLHFWNHKAMNHFRHDFRRLRLSFALLFQLVSDVVDLGCDLSGLKKSRFVYVNSRSCHSAQPFLACLRGFLPTHLISSLA